MPPVRTIDALVRPAHSIRTLNYRSRCLTILDTFRDWRGYFEGYQVAYTSVLDHLRKRQHFEEDLLLLNYLPIDETLHKDERQIAASHATQIRTDLKHLADTVTTFAKRTRVEDKLVIFVASDHGSTKYPAGVRNGLDDKFYKSRATNRHHRYISVPQQRALEPTGYDKDQCYVVRADQFGTHEDYFIARGYSRFIETNESVYVHGGLTPEETIVPFCRLVRAEIEAKQPTIYLLENIIRYSVKSDVVLVVGNPNDYELTNLELTILQSDLPGVVVERISANSPKEFAVPVRIRRHPGVPLIETITVQGSFLINEQRFVLDAVDFPVEVRPLQESKAGLEFSELGF